MKLIVFNKYFKSSEFFKNVVTLISGSMLAQFIPFLLAPIVARLYYPGDYAVLAAYSSISVLLTIVATGMYDSALMLDATDQEAINTASVAVTITLTISVFAGMVIIIFRDSIANFTGNESVSFWLYLVPLTVFFTGLYSTLAVWTNRKKRYKRLAVNKVIQTISTTGLTIGLGFAGWREKGLLVSMISGQAIAFLLLFTQTLKEDKALIRFIKKNSIKLSLKKHIDFPKYNMPQGFLDGLRESSIILIISNNFTSSILGSYSYAISMLNKPLQIIGNAFGQVFYQSATEKFNNKSDLYTFTLKTVKTLALISAPFFLTVIIFGKPIFSIVLGNRWAEAGMFAQILSIWLFFRFILSPITQIPIILKRQKTFFLFGLLYNITMPVTILVTTLLTLNIVIVLITFTLIGVFNFIIQQIWIQKLLTKRI
jgi:O-antigen/teichoic acid export membrane protein